MSEVPKEAVNKMKSSFSGLRPSFISISEKNGQAPTLNEINEKLTDIETLISGKFKFLAKGL